MNDIYIVKKNIERIIRGNSTNFLDSKFQNLVKRKLGKINYNIYYPYKGCDKVIYYVTKCPNIYLYEIKTCAILKRQEIMGTLFSLSMKKESR